ncbi:hypothetical protein SAMN04487995_6173 [Dyadobacter koreensis]|uniref:Dual OB-containing domain-containing protein n=1 Tax=Dyadobacter koreensis TaxID=408657 RepID=A0A1H7BGF9_9BACT|nr:hypothetical protein [Dyadobacter koreensis]SEJ73300.1 hypothetical protein SAMN04487995_6173 [Dyadobacter koreensis]
MTIRFVCLANSVKEGGRCLAGIELNKNNEPLIGKNGPKWIRPICKTQHGKIYTHWVTHIKLLDIVEIESTGFPGKPSYQSENIFFKDEDLKVVGRFDRNELSNLCDNRYYIFGNWGKALSTDEIVFLDYSLVLIHVSQFQVTERINPDDPGKKKIRLQFSYHETNYDFPVTDPVFLQLYGSNPAILEIISSLYLCVSIGINFNGWYYKLVAGIVTVPS